MHRLWPKIPAGVERAVGILATHSALEHILQIMPDPKLGTTTVDVAIRVGLPNAWAADGISPNGVRVVEPVTLVFGDRFPLSPPAIYLRADFGRSLAHMMPGPPERRPVPCIYEGSIGELFQQQGLSGVVNQLVAWLDNAALGRLIHEKQGWEPTRRDTLTDFIVADADYLRSQVSLREGYAAFRFRYLRYPVAPNGSAAFFGEIDKERLTVNAKSVGGLFNQRPLKEKPGAVVGSALAFLVWPGKGPSGREVVADRYLPENVTSLATLSERAAEYGCGSSLRTALDWLQRCVRHYAMQWGASPLALVLCPRRPFNIIGSDSSIELCPYLVEVEAPQLFARGDQTPVRPVGHRHVVTSSLLKRMSGTRASGESLHWIQFGAGSLGSKIALHLARAGRAPEVVVDSAFLSPHNAARHALTPGPNTTEIGWNEPKAVALAEAIKGLGQAAEAHVEDIVAITRRPGLSRRVLGKSTWAVVNSTASLTVREALASTPEGITVPRVIETSLFADGRIGLLSVEGPQRNPNTGDLISIAYAVFQAQPSLRTLVFSDREALTRHAVGEGCGSTTMVMSDARVSLMAAPMAEAVTRMQEEGLPATGGRLMIGVLGGDGMSVSWCISDVPVCIEVPIEEAAGWTVRIPDRVHETILSEVACWSGVETGGILMGRFSEAAQAFYVTDVLPAPDDSARSACEFVLGTAGVRATVNSYAESCNHSLYCLGTWHSHLGASDPSGRDRATAAAIALGRPTPSVLLIYGPTGYRAVLAAKPTPAIVLSKLAAAAGAVTIESE